MLDIAVVATPQATQLKLIGALDAPGGLSLQMALQQLREAGNQPVVVDLANVTCLTSVGLRVLLQAYNALNHDGLALCSPNPAIQPLLQMSGLSGLLPTYADPQTAMDWFTAQCFPQADPGYRSVNS